LENFRKLDSKKNIVFFDVFSSDFSKKNRSKKRQNTYAILKILGAIFDSM